MFQSRRVGTARNRFHPKSLPFPTSKNRLLVVLAIALAGFTTTACNLTNLGSKTSSNASQLLSIRRELPQATVGQAYDSVLNISGGLPPYQFALDSGSLPTGLRLSPSNGTISGMVAKSGAFTFAVVVTDLPRTDRGYQQFTLSAASPAPQIRVKIMPSSSITLNSGATAQFRATVTGTSNTQVTWSASNGTVSPTGLFTAPSVSSETSANVTATSVMDRSQASVASILVRGVSTVSAGADNRYCGPGNKPDFGATTDGYAILPTACFYTALSGTPSAGSVIAVSAGSDLQSAIDNAKCGDTLMLESGAVWTTGQLNFPPKSCNNSNWITIRTSAPDSALPAEGTRLTPCYAGVSSLAGRPPLNCSSTKNVLARIEYSDSGGYASGPLVFKNGATHYRFIGLEVAKHQGIYVNSLASPAANAAFDHIVFDRVWFHGDAVGETTRGLMLNGGSYVAVVDSYFSDFHCLSLGRCTDAQAIGGGGGSLAGGTYKIVDNFLESSGENVLFGGSGSTHTPADIEIRRNHFFKPMTWLAGQPGFVGVKFVVKNHLEFKNAQRALVEGNIMENSWGGFSQAGFSVVITPKNAGSCDVCRVTDITFRFNTIRHVGGGFQLANIMTWTGFIAREGQRYSIHDIVADDISSAKYAGFGVFAQVETQDNSPAVPLLNNVTVDHVTAFPDKTLLNVGGAVSPKMANFTFTNSIVTAGLYPIWSVGGGATNCAYSDVPIKVLETCFSPLKFLGNIVIGQPSNYKPRNWPSGNTLVATAKAVGFTNFNSGNGGEYELFSSSTFKNTAPQGKDPGADIAAIQQETAGVY
jgi:Putative Ig domain